MTYKEGDVILVWYDKGFRYKGPYLAQDENFIYLRDTMKGNVAINKTIITTIEY